jgi:ribonuclease P protein component
MGKFSFHKFERLSKKKSIQELFDKGSSFTLYPFRVHYLAVNSEDIHCNKVLFTVAKKNFRRAVDRNRIKRLMREAYRLSKIHMVLPVKLHIAYIYVGKEILPFEHIQKKMITSFSKFKVDENPL